LALPRVFDRYVSSIEEVLQIGFHQLTLRKAGVECVVFEKNASQYRERDWNMGLHWGAPALKSLMPTHWWDQIQSIQVDPHVPTKKLDTLTWLQGDTGEPLAAITMGPFYRLRRSKLRGLLSKDIDIEYDKRLVDVAHARDEQSVTAYFADGSSATGRILIGADGAQSMTRQLLLGPELGVIGKLTYAATFVQCKFTKEQALHLRSFHPLYLASAHPNNLFAFFGMHDAADPDDPASWTFFFYISWQSSLEEQEATKDWTDAQRLAQQKDLAKSFCDPWKSALEWTPDDASAWYMGLTSWDPGHEGHRWNNHSGLITLIGDACHPMTYQRGQGLNHSVTDASQLRDALVMIHEGANHVSTISAFEDGMIRRGGTEVREGNANTMMLHDWAKVRQSPLFTKGMKKNDA
jgi:2-polyprenyl-6-methoxyphenol hydroxylase-like FAD-dependent oxidoreductase